MAAVNPPQLQTPKVKILEAISALSWAGSCCGRGGPYTMGPSEAIFSLQPTNF